MTLEATTADGVSRAEVAFQSVGVLPLAGDLIFFRHQLPGHPHVEVFEGVPKAVVDHRVQHFAVAEAKAAPQLGQEVRAVRHGLHAAGDNHFRVPGLDGLCCERYSLQPRAAHLIDGHGGDPRIEPSFQARLAGRVLPKPRRDNVPHDDFIHLPRLDAGARHCFAHNAGAQIHCRKRRQRPLKFPDGRADGG